MIYFCALCCKLCLGPDVRIKRAASLSTANRQMRILDYIAGVAVVATLVALPFSFYYFLVDRYGVF